MCCSSLGVYYAVLVFNKLLLGGAPWACPLKHHVWDLRLGHVSHHNPQGGPATSCHEKMNGYKGETVSQGKLSMVYGRYQCS